MLNSRIETLWWWSDYIEKIDRYIAMNVGYLYHENSCNLWTGAPIIYLESVSNIIDSVLGSRLQVISRRLDVECLCIFYKYFHVSCSEHARDLLLNKLHATVSSTSKVSLLSPAEFPPDSLIRGTKNLQKSTCNINSHLSFWILLFWPFPHFFWVKSSPPF